jgi:arsenate reductase-like glutaredoxin family protein
MDVNTMKALEQLFDAKRQEIEAIKTLIPGLMKGHLDIICSEIRSMVIESLMSTQSKEYSKETSSKEQGATNKVKKVNIG